MSRTQAIRRYTRPANKLALVKTAIMAGKAAYGAYKNFKSSAPSAQSAPVTNQYDVRTTYTKKRKRIPRRIRNRNRKFANKVKNIVNGDKKVQKVIFQQNLRIITAANTQWMHGSSFYLNSMNGASAGDRDLQQILTANGESATSITNYYLKNGLMDISIKNTSSTTGAYLECYYWIGKKQMDNNQSFGISPTNTLTNLLIGGQIAQPANITGGVSTTNAVYGVTPFQNIAATSSCKIYKKQVIFMSPGQITDITLNVARNTKLNWQQVNSSLFDRRAKGVIFVQYGEPNSAVDATAGQPVASELNYNVTRVYHYTSDRDSLVDASVQTLAA